MGLSDRLSGEKKKSGEDDAIFPDKVVDPEILEDINREYIPEEQGKSDGNSVHASSENKSDDSSSKNSDESLERKNTFLDSEILEDINRKYIPEGQGKSDGNVVNASLENTGDNSSEKKRRFKAVCKRRRSSSPYCDPDDVLISSFKRPGKKKKPAEIEPCSKEADLSSSEKSSSFSDSEDPVYSANSDAEENDDAEITGQKVKKDTQLIGKKEKKAVAKKPVAKKAVEKKAVAKKDTKFVGKKAVATKTRDVVGNKVTKAPVKKGLGKNDTQLVVQKHRKGVAKKETGAVVKKERKLAPKKPNVDDVVNLESEDDVEVVESCNRIVLNQRVPYLLFLKDVLPILTDLQKSKIKEIGFGPFLSLDLDYHRSDFAAKLVCAVNYNKCTMRFRSEHVEIMKEDVEVVYGLPSGDVVVDDAPDPLDKSWAEFVKRYRSIFGKSVTPTNTDVIYEIKKHVAQAEQAVLNGEEEVVSDEFVWHFLMCDVNCCIRSTSNTQLHYKFLYSCRDVDQISKLDWCGYVYTSLFDSVKKWHNNAAFFTGPLPFLMIFYFDRLQRGYKEWPRSFPLISVWNKSMIAKRMEMENEARSIFGDGKVLDRMDRFANVNVPINDSPKVAEKNKFGEGSSKSIDEIESYLTNFHDLGKRIGSDLKEMYALIGKGRDLFGEEAIGVKMMNVVQNIWTKYTKCGDHNMGQEGKDTESEHEKNDRPFPHVLSGDDYYNEIFDHPAYVAELESVIAKANEMFCVRKEHSTKNNDVPSFDLLSQETVGNFGVFSPSPDAGFKTPAATSTLHDTVMMDVEAGSTENIGSKLDGGVSDNAKSKDDDSSDEDMEILLKLNKETRVKRVIKLPAKLRSPYMVESDNLLKNVPFLKKRILEYALSTLDKDEMLYYDTLTIVNRDEVLSLSGTQHVANNCIDAWAFQLNAENKERSKDVVNRFFFTTSPILLLTTDMAGRNLTVKERRKLCLQRLFSELKHSGVKHIEDVELVFFPVSAYAHFYLFVVNNIKKTFDIIDNRPLGEDIEMEDKYGAKPSLWLQLFSRFWKKVYPSSSKELEKYTIRLLSMPWMSLENDTDCGIFAMKHMEKYYGEDSDWDIGIKKDDVETMKIWRFDYCSKLLLNDANTVLSDVYKKAKKWVKDNEI